LFVSVASPLLSALRTRWPQRALRPLLWDRPRRAARRALRLRQLLLLHRAPGQSARLPLLSTDVFHQAPTVLQGKRPRAACASPVLLRRAGAFSATRVPPFFPSAARLGPLAPQAPGAHLRCFACVWSNVPTSLCTLAASVFTFFSRVFFYFYFYFYIYIATNKI